MSLVKNTIKIQWAVTILLTLVICFIPVQGFFTGQVKSFFAITVFCLALAAFELVPILFISIILPALYALFKVADASVIMSPWLGTTFLLIVGAMFMSQSLDESGLLRRIAFWMMTKIKGSYFLLMLGLMIVAILMNIFTSGNGYFLMAALGTGLCIALKGMKKNVGAGIATAIMLGGCTSHAYTYQVTSWGPILSLAGDLLPNGAITPLNIILHNWPLMIISVLILWIVSKMYKPEEPLGDVQFFEEQLAKMGKMTRREKVNAVMLILVLIYIFTISIHKLDLNLGFAIIPWMVLLPGINGADDKTIRNMNFSVIFFVAACMSIGVVATNLGMDEIIGQLCRVMLGGHTSAFAIFAIIFALVFILNFFMTPLAIFSLIIVPVLNLAIDMGFDPVPFAYAVNACSEAIIFPYEYVPYLLVFSFSMISMKDFIKVNVLRSIIFFGGYLAILVPYWMLIGLL